MMGLTCGLFTQVSNSGPHGSLVDKLLFVLITASDSISDLCLSVCFHTLVSMPITLVYLRESVLTSTMVFDVPARISSHFHDYLPERKNINL